MAVYVSHELLHRRVALVSQKLRYVYMYMYTQDYFSIIMSRKGATKACS